MKVGSLTGSSAGNKLAELPVTKILFICCMLFSSALYAQEIPESEIPAAQSPPTEVPATEVPTAETNAEPAVAVDAQADEASKLEEILKNNNKCLRCHNKDKTKLLEDGNEMSIQVHKEDYIESAHGEVRCISCHRAIGKRKHPSRKTNITIATERDYSVEMNKSCKLCHEENYTQYEHSIHASMVKQGSSKAPLCTDCHSAHRVESMEVYQPETGYPCKRCHERVFNSYTTSVHGDARLNGNVIRNTHIQAPICSDCHQSHDINAMAIGDTLRSTCLGCHENIILLHNQWLPNAGTHLDIVSCAVCHAPFAKRRFDLHLYDNVTQLPVSQQEGDDTVQQQLQLMEEAGDSAVDTLKSWRAKQDGNEQDPLLDISLRGRMEVMSGVAAHQIASKSFAIRTCDSCHDDSRQRQNVTFSITKADGRKQSFEADRDVLESVTAVNSISDFYALGGNPNKLLDYMLLLSLLAGIAVPIGHFTMGKMIKENIDRGEQ